MYRQGIHRARIMIPEWARNLYQETKAPELRGTSKKELIKDQIDGANSSTDNNLQHIHTQKT